MGFQQVLRDTGTNLQVSLYSDEVLTDPTANTVTVTITKADGTTLIGPDAATTRLSAGVYQYGLADQADLDYLTVVWKATFSGLVQTVTDYVEIVGGFYVSIPEIRAQKNLSSTTTFTTAELRTARAWFEQKFERATGVAFVPRYKRLTLDGSGSTALWTGLRRLRSVRSVRAYSDASTYTTFSAGELADIVVSESGELCSPLGFFSARYVVEVEHGYDGAPNDVREAALVGVRDKLLSDQTGNRVYAVQTEDGIVRSSTPSPKSPFGLPFVDEVVAAYRTPGIG